MFSYILFKFDYLYNIFLVIYNKLLLLNMQINFNLIFDLLLRPFLILKTVFDNIINKTLILEEEEYLEYDNDDDNIINNIPVNESSNNSSTDTTIYEFIDDVIEDIPEIIIYCLFSSYIWIFMPFLLGSLFAYILHTIAGFYSAYIDYYQKNIDHFNSSRGFIPAFFIFFLFLFSFLSIFFFIITQYLKYLLWILFI